jgi:hypothetical protein
MPIEFVHSVMTLIMNRPVELESVRSISVGAAARPANHFGNEILEARWWHFVVSFVHGRVHVQARVRHDPVDQIINNGGDAINSTEALIKRRLLWWCWHVCRLVFV